MNVQGENNCYFCDEPVVSGQEGIGCSRGHVYHRECVPLDMANTICQVMPCSGTPSRLENGVVRVTTLIAERCVTSPSRSHSDGEIYQVQSMAADPHRSRSDRDLVKYESTDKKMQAAAELHLFED